MQPRPLFDDAPTAPLRAIATDDAPTTRLPRIAREVWRPRTAVERTALRAELEKLTHEFCELREALDRTAVRLDAVLTAYRDEETRNA
jgi:hypothetical protein